MAISIWHDFIKIELESRCNLKMFRLISAENGNKKTQGYRKWNEIKRREMCICDVCVCVCRGKGGRFWLVDRGGGSISISHEGHDTRRLLSNRGRDSTSLAVFTRH